VKTIAIHQPNFFPWLGYFDKLNRVDVFVFLDDVQHSKTGGTWSNRVKLAIGGEAKWVTAPTIRAYSGLREVRQIEFDESTDWRAKLLRTIEITYRKSTHFEEAWQVLKPLVENRESLMAAYNEHAVRVIAGLLGLTGTQLVPASSVSKSGTGTMMLITITRALGGEAYLSGYGAGGYQDNALFQAAGIKLLEQGYKHPVYAQHGTRQFIPGLSVIDALMNCGVNGVAELMNASRQLVTELAVARHAG